MPTDTATAFRIAGNPVLVAKGKTPEIRWELPAASQVPFATEEEFCQADLCDIDMAALTRITANAASGTPLMPPEIYKLTFGQDKPHVLVQRYPPKLRRQACG